MLMRRCILCIFPGLFLLLLYDKEIVYGSGNDDGSSTKCAIGYGYERDKIQCTKCDPPMTGSDTNDQKPCRIADPGEVIVEDGTKFVCDHGYTRNEKRVCHPCSFGKFKDKTGDEQCDDCGDHQTNKDKDRTKCVCEAGFKRIGTKCQPCEVGTYKPVVGDKTSCLLCKEAVKKGSVLCPEKEDEEETPSPLPYILGAVGGVIVLALIIVIGVVIHKQKKKGSKDSIITLMAAMSSNMNAGIDQLATSMSGLLAGKKSSSKNRSASGSPETYTYSPNSPTSSGSKLSPDSFDSPTTESRERPRKSRRRGSRSRGSRSRGSRSRGSRSESTHTAISKGELTFTEDVYPEENEETPTGLCYDYDTAGIHQNDS